jgi:hypothetical protein
MPPLQEPLLASAVAEAFLWHLTCQHFLHLVARFDHRSCGSQHRRRCPQVTGDFRGNYGPTIADRRHARTANFAYDLPSYRTQQGLLGHFVGGWEVSGVQTFQTGLPRPPCWATIFVSGLELPATTRLAQAACSAPRLGAAVPIRSPTPTPTLQIPTRVGSMRPRSLRRLPSKQRKQTSILAPSLVRDFGAPTSPFSRTLRFSERFTGQLGFETFNTFNPTNPICCFSTNLISSF